MTMTALTFDRFGEPDAVLEARALERPIPLAGEVLVEIHAASLNPSDLKNVQGHMHGTTLPRIPGRDFAGVVIEGPPELLGCDVWGAGGDIGFTRDGSHAEYIAVPSAGVSRKPKALSMDEAAACGVNFITAMMGLDAIALAANETIAITGSSGGVGSAVVQLARERGAHSIGVDRRAASADALAWSRADSTILSGDRVSDELRAAMNGRGVDCVYDTVGAPLFTQIAASLAPGGRWVIIASQGPREATLDIIAFYRNQSRLFGIDSRKLDTVACAAILDRLRPSFESGALHAPAIARRIPLRDGRAAYVALRDGTADGKIVLVRT